jgi:hypothetical protein
MLPLKVVGPGGSLSTLMLPCIIGKMPVPESVLAGSNGDSGIQLRPDSGVCDICSFLSVFYIIVSIFRIIRPRIFGPKIGFSYSAFFLF